MSLLKQHRKELLNSQKQAADTKKHSKTGRQLVSAGNYDFTHWGRCSTDNRPVVIIAWQTLILCVCVWVRGSE